MDRSRDFDPNRDDQVDNTDLDTDQTGQDPTVDSDGTADGAEQPRR